MQFNTLAIRFEILCKEVVICVVKLDFNLYGLVIRLKNSVPYASILI